MTYILITAILFSFLPQTTLPREVTLAREMIAQRRYDDAVSKLEQTLEAKPGQADALMFMGAAVLYGEMNFLKAQKLFEQSFQAGGGAVFWVNHSHEKLGTEEMADYCRGWLYLRKGEVEFAPTDGEHSFHLPYSEIKEFKQNRLSKLFHIKDSNKTFNFRPRSGDEGEILLTMALYKKFAR
jgi:tetratricopeptide (TPR) repeat protein